MSTYNHLKDALASHGQGSLTADVHIALLTGALQELQWLGVTVEEFGDAEAQFRQQAKVPDDQWARVLGLLIDDIVNESSSLADQVDNYLINQARELAALLAPPPEPEKKVEEPRIVTIQIPSEEYDDVWSISNRGRSTTPAAAGDSSPPFPLMPLVDL